MEPISAAAGGARAAGAAVRMAQAAASPYVMVKHGRREDRAAVYDRFTAACAAFFFDGEIDRSTVTELLAAQQAVHIRAPLHVRTAANELFTYLMSVDTTEGGPKAELQWMKLTRKATLTRKTLQPGAEYPFELRGDEVVSSDFLLMGLYEFTEMARLDVTARWYHALLTPWGKRWWLKRR
ncbi:hypothetical protein [Streptomyces sp. NPDC058401]|uniref:hypothetical protein n=1 Tax=Streptomyces sp. NPDC058401 TaxID=3346480 RepID=UPI00365739CB